MGFPVTFVVASRFFPVGGVRCSRSYRGRKQEAEVPASCLLPPSTGPTPAAKPERAKRRAHNGRAVIGKDAMPAAYSRTTPNTAAGRTR
jgi:hypothetical protein